jgi:hypothetical protein
LLTRFLFGVFQLLTHNHGPKINNCYYLILHVFFFLDVTFLINSSLGSALLKDLMGDLSNLESLEMALEEHERNAPVASSPNVSSVHLGKPSSDVVSNGNAASFVVSHQAQRQAQDFLSGSGNSATYGTSSTTMNFDPLAAHEFLMADSAKKSKQQQQQLQLLHGSHIPFNTPTTMTRVASNDSDDGVHTAAAKNLVNSLLIADEEEYDINEEPTKFRSSSEASNYRPILVSATTNTTAPTIPNYPQQAAKSLLVMLQQKQPERQQQRPMQPTLATPSISQPLPPHMIVDNRSIPAAAISLGNVQKQEPHKISMHHVTMPLPTTATTGFPPHSVPQPQHYPPLASPPQANTTINTNAMRPLRKPPILFNNPHVTRVPPIRADLVASSRMAPRDILYVVHAMLRPLLPLVENPYDNDYYFQIFTERQGMSPAEKPAWKDEKEQMVGKELHFRQVVVERAKDWKEDKQTLGHIVKSDIKRPRALLAVPVLSKMGLIDEAITSNEECSQRAQLWRSRVLVDKGYQAHLELVEAHRLLTTNVTPEQGQELIRDIQSNVVLLQSYFGLTMANGKEPVVDVPTLRACLNLSKGQELVARCMEERSLPHASACVLLPYIICTIFADARPANMTDVTVAKEERLCRSLTALVLLHNPAVSKDVLLQCLEGMVEIAAKTNLKKVLGYAARAAVMHAVLSRGGEVFTQSADTSQDLNDRWLIKEMEFRNLLSSS